jgi:hypothetical protein
MRVAVFVAVLAAHIVLIWLFLSLRRWVLLPVPEEADITPIILPPVLEPAIALPFEPAQEVPWRAPLPAAAHQEVERLAREVRPDVASQATSVPEATASDPASQTGGWTIPESRTVPLRHAATNRDDLCGYVRGLHRR